MENLPIGCIFCYPSPICPEGFMPCDGRELSKQAYPELYAVIKNTWGETDTTFFLPDLQGLFVRGWDKDENIDPQRKLGSYQDDTFQGHSHKAECAKNGDHKHLLMTSVQGEASKAVFTRGEYLITPIDYDKNLEVYDYDKEIETSYSGKHKHKIQITEPTDDSYGKIRFGVETRPKNVALVYCIKVK